MTGAGYFEQRHVHPAGFGAVVVLHAAALAAVVLIKGPVFIHPVHPPTTATFIPAEQTPPPEPRQMARRTPRHAPPLYTPPIRPAEPINDNPIATMRFDAGAIAPIEIGRNGPANPPVHPPVRVAARIDPRFRDALQPDYPPYEQRLQHEGVVRVRIVIGTDGRVASIERLSATSDAFWQATRRQALARWRFRPASEDGHPIEGVMTMTVTFRLADAA